MHLCLDKQYIKDHHSYERNRLLKLWWSSTNHIFHPQFIYNFILDILLSSIHLSWVYNYIVYCKFKTWPLPVSLIAQLVEHYTSNHRVMASNPIYAPIFFRLAFCDCVSCILNSDSLSCTISLICSSLIVVSLQPKTSNYYVIINYHYYYYYHYYLFIYLFIYIVLTLIPLGLSWNALALVK